MANKKKSKLFILGIAVAFLLPLSFYLIVVVLSKDKIHLPNYYMPETVDSSMVDGRMQRDTIFHKVGDIQLTNQLGEVVTLNGTLKDRVVLVNFFYSNCPPDCKVLMGNMALIQRGFRRDRKMILSRDTTVQILSISVDPRRDTVQALRTYADSYHANHDVWWFLTGNWQQIDNFSRNELGLWKPADADSLVHNTKLVLIDKDRHIRGYYNGLDTFDLRKCADDIVLLTMEKKRKKH